MNTFWAVFTAGLSLPLVTFLVAEGHAIATGKPTYTQWIRAKLGLAPKQARRAWAPWVFAGVLAGFNVWFIPHILLGIWPS